MPAPSSAHDGNGDFDFPLPPNWKNEERGEHYLCLSPLSLIEAAFAAFTVLTRFGLEVITPHYFHERWEEARWWHSLDDAGKISGRTQFMSAGMRDALSEEPLRINPWWKDSAA